MKMRHRRNSTRRRVPQYERWRAFYGGRRWDRREIARLSARAPEPLKFNIISPAYVASKFGEEVEIP